MDVSSLIDVKPNSQIPRLAPGDTVRVKVKVVEGDKERIQVFQGTVIKVGGGGMGASFTVRRVTYGVGVERTFPIYSPIVDSVEVVRHGKVRRARLFYLRGLSSKQARIKERRVDASKEQALAAATADAPPEETTEAEELAEAEPEVEATVEIAAQPEAEGQPPTEVKAEVAAEPEAEAQPEAEIKAGVPAQSEAEEKTVAEEQPKAQE
jgi:large subunit ribosomal protein L19